MGSLTRLYVRYNGIRMEGIGRNPESVQSSLRAQGLDASTLVNRANFSQCPIKRECSFVPPRHATHYLQHFPQDQDGYFRMSNDPSMW